MMPNTLTATIFALLIDFSGSTSSNCYGIYYRTINDSRRSVGYISSNTETYRLCDRHLLKDNAWYRFSSVAGGEMPTTKPSRKRCGTYIPIWMNGSHPAINDGVVPRKACANIPFKSPLGCGYSYSIKVRNCSGYYIYKLKSPKHCLLAYCAGSKIFDCSSTDSSKRCFENRPPFISMPDRLYALENSEWQIVINATDPEGYLMHYEYLRNKTVKSVSINNEIATIHVTQSGNLSLRVTDRQKLKSAPHTIEIVALKCRCQNKGRCKSRKSVSTKQEDISNYTCECLKPYTGPLCESSPCNNLPCFRGVNCFVQKDTYTCEKCPPALEGDGKNCLLVGDAYVVLAEMIIDSGLQWNDSLLNKTTILYKQRTVELENKIAQAYKSTKVFWTVVVVGNHKGGVVEFLVVLKEHLDNPLEPIKTHARKNNFGNFKVNPPRVKIQDHAVVEGTFSILSGLQWTDELLNSNSAHFKTVAFKVANEIDKSYSGEEGFVYVLVTGFRKNKFMVEFKLVWRIKADDPFKKLWSKTKDGNLGKIVIDRSSIKKKTKDVSSNDTSYPKHIIYPIVVVTVLVIVCLTASVARWIYMKSTTHNGRIRGFPLTNKGMTSV